MADQPIRIGDYEIVGELGAGGMATVYRARHAILETMHAVKVLDPSYRENPQARQRFLDEAKLQAKHLDHPNIVKVTNIVATADHAALVMELVEGGSLESELAGLGDDPAEIKRIMLAVLDAVGHAHDAGVIHRDLKPANVLLATVKEGPKVPKVTDFGIAKVTVEAATGKTGKKSTHGDARMGTLHYMSPEQIRRAKDVTPRSDVFSLGAMLYEMATGAPAFGGDSEYDVMENIVNARYQPAAERKAGLDPVIAVVIDRALASDPADRFASCAEMAGALRGEVAVGSPVRAAAPPPRTRTVPARPAASRRTTVVVVVALGALGLAAGAFFLGRGSGHEASPSASGEQVASITVDATPPAAPPDVAPLAVAPADAAIDATGVVPDPVVAAPVPRIDAGVRVPARLPARRAPPPPPRQPPPPPQPPPGARVVVSRSEVSISTQLGFAAGSATLDGRARAVLDTIASVLNSHPDLRVAIAGHTDSSEDAGLGAKRAAAARAHLVQRGIAGSRLTTRGFDANLPIASNATDEGRQRNRRVEFQVIP